MSKKIQLKITCRTCAKSYPGEPLLPIFNGLTFQNIEPFLTPDFLILTDDGLPQQICLDCLNQFQFMHEFMRLCEKSQITLNNLFKSRHRNNRKSVEIETKSNQKEDPVNKIEIPKYNTEYLDEITDNKIDLDEITDNKIELDEITDNRDELDSQISNEFYEIELINIEDQILLSKKEKFHYNDLVEEINIDDLITEQFEYAENYKQYYCDSDDGELFDDDFNTHSCQFCNKNFETFQELDNHLQFKHKRRQKVTILMCELCGELVDALKFKSHMNNHYGIENEKYQCEFCQRKFSVFKDFKWHRNKHTASSLFKCQYCKQTYLLKSKLDIHIKTKHTGNQMIIPKKRTIKKGPKANIQCPYCRKLFHNSVSLVKHCQTHRKPDLETAKHICSYCGALFKRADHLKIHINSIHLKSEQFECNYCSKIFYTGFDLNSHVKKKHILTQVRLECEFCNRTLANKQCLQRHQIEFHSTEQQYQCPICDEKFFKNKELIEHAGVHGIVTDEIHKELIIKEYYDAVNNGGITNQSNKSGNLELITFNTDNHDEINVQEIIEYDYIGDE